MKKASFIILGVGLILPVLVVAKIGVGVGTGVIRVDQPLKPGLIYTLPSLAVLNTGDEPYEYGVGIQYHENQPELRPPREWFSFEPSQFHLEPEQVQHVQIKLSLPVKGAEPGNYFAFLQGYPLKKTGATGTSVGIAAAAKLYFTVVPANLFAGFYYRIISLLTLYAPWSYVILTIVALAVLITVFRRYVSFNIGINIRKK